MNEATRNARAPSDDSTTAEDSPGPRSSVRRRLACDGEPARRPRPEAALVNESAEDVEGHALVRTLEMMALIIPLELG